MRVRKAIWMPGFFAVLALVLAACGGSGPTATTSPPLTGSQTSTAASTSETASSELSAEEEEYLSAVKDAQLLSVQVFQNFGQVFSQTYPLRETLLAALLEVGVGTPFIGNLAALEALDPPDRFQEDHEIWLETVREQLRLDTEAADAVRDGDLVRFVHLNGDLGETNIRGILSLSRVFCLGMATDPRVAAGCAPEGLALVGEYAKGINNLLREVMPGISSARGTLGFRLSLTPEEMGQVLASMGAGAEGIFQGFESRLGTMTPPDEMLADHERMRAYIGKQLAIFVEVDRLRESGDLNAVRFELEGLEQAYCDVRQSFESSDFKEAVAIFFAGGPGVCGGEPF